MMLRVYRFVTQNFIFSVDTKFFTNYNFTPSLALRQLMINFISNIQSFIVFLTKSFSKPSLSNDHKFVIGGGGCEKNP